MSGLRVYCTPETASEHDCCPPAEKSPTPKTAPFSNCCVVSDIRYRESTALAPSGNEPVRAAVQAALVETPHPIRSVAASTPITHAISPPISPPLSPLHQSCLLLI